MVPWILKIYIAQHNNTGRIKAAIWEITPHTLLVFIFINGFPVNSILYRKSDTVNFLNLKFSNVRILKWTIFISYCTIITNRLIWCCRTGPPDVVDQTDRMLPEQVHRMLSIRLTGCSRTGPPDVACLKEFSMVFIIFKLYWPQVFVFIYS